ncbi:MAG: formylmethanofuran dehydrogenase subunit E family protein, partial [Isosphaeraceae bacterium]
SRAGGPVTLLAVLMDRTPGRREGRDFSHTRYKATLTVDRAEPDVVADATAALHGRLERLKEIHGAAGPWAFVGCRIGERALKDLGLPRHSFPLMVVHHCPAQVQYSCIADGVQAATGASPGKLNLVVKESTLEGLKTVVEDRKTGRRLTFVLRPGFIESIRDVPYERFDAEVRRIAGLSDDAIFTVSKSDGEAK